ISKPTSSNNYVHLTYSLTLDNSYLNKELNWSFDLLNLTNNSARILLDTGEYALINVPLSEDIVNVSLSNIIQKTEIICYVSYLKENYGDYYISNFNLTVS
ncbi:MAG: hypothetical protein IJJ47_05935, partial [Methanosphaera sp.]|nr:hypothetical protein [Methanosphaera sp.]